MREYQAIVARIASEMPEPVLDWGCGHGQISHMLRERAVAVTAFEWSADASPDDEVQPLERYPEIEAHRSSNPVALPFADDSFGCVLSCGVLEHVQRPAESLDELHRVLRPGGRLLVYKLPNRHSYLEMLARRLGYYYHGALVDDQVYTRRTAIDLLLEHGFRVDAFRRTNLLPLTVAHPLAQALAGPIWVTNRALGRLPGVSLLATNLELDATAL
ncbi:MAG TPA: class I SAM-dependent methyltransferase [Solirubrobacteraceae bacterium]|jgi:ubiquinone/menaquinone biosynthesis C-methylase UbiE|nr:class I SAM-dependent methyltransferase [Solirubrobacteraceae bacterium]